MKNIIFNELPIVQQAQTYFRVDKIPNGLTFLEKISFCNTLRESVEGVILKTYKVSEYVVHVYTKASPSKKQFFSLLIEKINFLLSIIGESVVAEIWIVKEGLDYSCFGIYNNVPVFFKSFPSIDDIQFSISEMKAHIERYADLSCIRVFGFNPSEIDFGKIGVFEYSANFLRKRMQGCNSLNEYCLHAHSGRLEKNKITKYLLAINLVVNMCSIGVFYMNRMIQRSVVASCDQPLDTQ